MAGESGTQPPDKDHIPNVVQLSKSTSSTSSDPTEELTKGIKNLSTDEHNVKSEDVLSDDGERSWSSGEDTVVDEPSDVDNRRQDAIDRIMKSFCATLETKLSVSPEAKVKKEKETPGTLPKLSDFRSQAKLSSLATPPRLSDFKSLSKQSSAGTPPKLSDFKSLSKKSSTGTPPKLSDFKSLSKPSTPVTTSRLSDFKSKPSPTAASPSVSPLPRLADFKSKPSPTAPSPSTSGLRLADFKSLPKPSPSAGQHNLPPVLDPFLLQSATLAFPAISPASPASLPSPVASPLPTPAPEKSVSSVKSETQPTPPGLASTRVTEAAFARISPESLQEHSTANKNKDEGASRGGHEAAAAESAPVPDTLSRGASEETEEERQRRLLEDILVRGERLDSLEGVSDLAAAAKAFKATAEAHTGGGAIWDTVGRSLGNLFGLGGASGAAMASPSSPAAFHGSFVSRSPMVQPQPSPQQPAPARQNHFFGSASQFPSPLGNATAGYDLNSFNFPLGGPVQLERSMFPADRRISESSVHTSTSSQTNISRNKRERTIEESDLSEEEEEDMARPIFPSKRKSTGYKPRAETGLTHESREAVHEPDGDGRRKKAKKTTPDASGAVGGGGKQKFACPYFKRNPRKYRNWTSCPGPGWEEVHRVKTHLYRRHALPLQCPRCWDVFKTDTVLQAHLQSDPPCTVKQNSVPHEGFTKDQEKRLRSRKKAHADMTDEDKWNEIYQILFPDDDPDAIPGPYYDTFDDEDGPTPASASGSGDLDDYASFVRREMPALVRRELEVLFKNESRDVQDRLGLQVEQIVLDLQPRLMGLYKQSQIPLSEYGPAQQQADYGVVANVSTPISTSGLSSGCGQGVSPCSGVSPGYVTSPAPVGMLTPESTTGYTGDVPYYGAFLTPNMPAMAASAGMGGGHPLYTADSALLGTGGADFNLDTNQFSGVDELNWDDAFGRILDPEVFMPRQAEVFGGGYGF